MKRISALLLFALPALFLLPAMTAQAQGPRHERRHPLQVPPGYFASLNAAPRHLVSNQLSVSTNAAVQAEDPRVVSLPTFTGAFNSGGYGYSYTMAGRAPATNQTTTIPTLYIPLSLYFDSYFDANGNPITIDATTVTNEITRSPLFENAEYATGTTQFVDAQMRAEFWPDVNRGRRNNFHVLLSPPRTLNAVTIEVPPGSGVVYQAEDGTYYAQIDYDFLLSQLNTLLQTEPVTVDAIPIFLTRNAIFSDFVNQQPGTDCCIGGLHAALETGHQGNRVFVQTAVFATALDADVADAIFQDPGNLADVNALSHELAETLNDPFGDNVTPEYQLPGQAQGVCADTLEVGDVVEGLPPDYTEVTLHGFTYHPQTLGLLQWFEGIQPSNAIGGSYSFPDTSKLTGPFAPCGLTPTV
ncbi:MAG TPA: hypothetical protein VHX37_01250 [Acidobacteriaceae bacterium]|jgi:hypothetical protein|nr:hypothetical protein [Acidobacteriaceae bacterium]